MMIIGINESSTNDTLENDEATYNDKKIMIQVDLDFLFSLISKMWKKVKYAIPIIMDCFHFKQFYFIYAKCIHNMYIKSIEK